jgi:hypothetical protein
MTPQAYAALVKEIAKTLGGGPAASEVRKTLAAVGARPTPPDIIAASDQLGRFLMAADRPADAVRLHQALIDLMPMVKVPDWTGGVVVPPQPPAAAAPPSIPPARAAQAAAPPRPALPARGPVLVASDPFSMAANAVEQAMWGIKLGEARDRFPAALAAARVPMHFARVFQMVGPIFENWERTEAWLKVREAMAAHAAEFTGEGARIAVSVELRLCLALRDYAGFATGYARLAALGPLAREDEVLGVIAAKVCERSFPDFTAEKIIGIGLPKSGTTSFTEALRILGFSALHLSNPATNDLFADDDLFLFDAFADLPLCEHFEQYYYMLPNAKFVYTNRPYASWKRSFLAEVNAPDEAAYENLKDRVVRGRGALWGNRLAFKAVGVLGNSASLQEAYDTYDRRVRRFFADKPANRFMEFNLALGHGWAELAAFTGRPVPSVPYPHKNPQSRVVQPKPAAAAS